MIVRQLFNYLGHLECVMYNKYLFKKESIQIKGQSWLRGIKCDCKRNWLWVRSPLEEIKYFLKFIYLHFGAQTKCGVDIRHLMPLKFGKENFVIIHSVC